MAQCLQTDLHYDRADLLSCGRMSSERLLFVSINKTVTPHGDITVCASGAESRNVKFCRLQQCCQSRKTIIQNFPKARSATL